MINKVFMLSFSLISVGMAPKNLRIQWKSLTRNRIRLSKPKWSRFLVAIFGNFDGCGNGKEDPRSRSKHAAYATFGCYYYRVVKKYAKIANFTQCIIIIFQQCKIQEKIWSLGSFFFFLSLKKEGVFDRKSQKRQ